MEFEVYMINGQVFHIQGVKCLREFYHFEFDDPQETLYLDSSIVDFYVEVEHAKKNEKNKGQKNISKHGR